MEIIWKKRITHVARFPNIVAALFIFDNLLKMLKKKRRKKSITKQFTRQFILQLNYFHFSKKYWNWIEL